MCISGSGKYKPFGKDGTDPGGNADGLTTPGGGETFPGSKVGDIGDIDCLRGDLLLDL